MSDLVTGDAPPDLPPEELLPVPAAEEVQQLPIRTEAALGSNMPKPVYYDPVTGETIGPVDPA